MEFHRDIFMLTNSKYHDIMQKKLQEDEDYAAGSVCRTTGKCVF